MDENKLSVVENRSEVVAPAYDRILELAISQGAPLDQLEKFLQLKRDHEAHEAKKEFYNAVADFKGETIRISKDKVNGQFKSRYSSLGNMLDTVNPILGRHGLSVSFDIQQSEKEITVACVLRHRLGHTEKSTIKAPPDTSGGGSKNPIQQIKSTITYLRAATFEAVTGLSSSDGTIDDDGNSAYKQPEYIDAKQQKEVKALVDEIYNPKQEMFWSYLGVEDEKTILKSDYKKAITALNQARASRGNK